MLFSYLLNVKREREKESEREREGERGRERGEREERVGFISPGNM